MSILENLRAETREIHEELDQLPFLRTLLSGEGTIDDYVKYLEIFGGIHAAVEGALFPVLTEPLKKFKDNTRIPAIEQDLSFFDTNIPKVDLPELTISEEGAPGALYVLEGSRLGGRYIAKQLKEKYKISDDALHFLTEQPEHKWKTVRAAIENSDAEHLEAIISTAKETFNFFKQGITLLMDRHETDRAQ
ncbi:MAG: biliverdin-producing heme oxygenase [Bacteroidota bacterium]